jgi:hypothetical protein
MILQTVTLTIAMQTLSDSLSIADPHCYVFTHSAELRQAAARILGDVLAKSVVEVDVDPPANRNAAKDTI